MPISNYTAYAEIVLLKDDQASREPRALKAQDVHRRIWVRRQPPKP